MAIPDAPLFPTAFDGPTNLYRVHDALRVSLAEDYNPGDTSIIADGDISNFPSTGHITLTEQQSVVDKRTISFYYGLKENNTFTDLTLLSNFTDVLKPKNITNITQNVMAEHHNVLKDALIAIEEFIGVKGTIDAKPLGVTLEGRTNFLRKLVFRPRAWFTATKKIGITPLTVEFTDQSFRNPNEWCWNFGDGTFPSTISTGCATISVSVISASDNLIISDNTTGKIKKTYYNPGIYDVALTVSNEFGEDTIRIPNYITVMVGAPDPAEIEFNPDNSTQALISDVLYTRTDAIVNVAITDSGERAGDPIKHFIWDMQDDLTHLDSPVTQGSYSVGGYYDVKIRTETELGGYRSTVFPSIINVIEKSNIWLMVSPDTSNNITKSFYAYEFGGLSEVFKTVSRSPVSVTRDPTPVSSGINSAQKIFEWKRNNGFVAKNRNGSGDKGVAAMYWTESLDPDIKIRFKEYSGFTDTWSNPVGFSYLSRGWNWVSFPGNSKIHFILGSDANLSNPPSGTSPTNQTKQTLNLNNYSVSSTHFNGSNYKNGAEELMENVGSGEFGDYSVYRSCMRDFTGFLARNDGGGTFFRLKSFYKTEGTVSDEFVFFRKLPDMVFTSNSTKLEGQLVSLESGIYFFNNSGEFSVWNDTAGVWSLGGPGAGSSPFRVLQDQSSNNYADLSNTLVATSDETANAYLSFDYSSKTFIKFNQTNLTFAKLSTRPPGEQLLIGYY